MAVMEENQIRRVPVVDATGCCCGIISQADVALCASESETGELVREVSKDSARRYALGPRPSRRSSRTPRWWWR